MRWPLIFLAACAALLGAAACESPLEPSAERRRYEALLAQPAWSRAASLDSAVAAQLLPHRDFSDFEVGVIRVARDAAAWTSLRESLRLPADAVPAASVEFPAEMVALAASGGDYYGTVVEVRHVTVVRETLFVLTATVRPGDGCAVAQTVSRPWDARVIPSSPLPVYFLPGVYRRDCRTFREVPAF